MTNHDPVPSWGICPTCFGTDWATTTAYINIKATPRYKAYIGSTLAWCAVIVVVGIIMFTVVKTARAELCLERIDNTITVKTGLKWNWRTVDGKKCWYLADRVLPREDLIWSYQSEEFDDDVIVKLRKWYYPQTDENGLLILKRIEEVQP